MAKKTTLMTSMAVCGSMLGSFLLILPIIYMRSGFFENMFASVFIFLTMMTTAVAIGTLLSGEEQLFANIVRREMGSNWSTFFAFIGGVLTTLAGTIQFLLASEIFYDLLQSVNPNVESFGRAWIRGIFLILYLVLSQLNSLYYIVKLSFISGIMIAIYFITVFVSFLQNIPHIDSGILERKEFTFNNVESWFSIQSYGFLCHPSLDAVVRENSNYRTNGRAVFGGYVMGLGITLAVGIIGSLAIYGKHPKDNSSLVGYFEGEWQAYVFSASLLVYLIMMYPIFPFVTRQQFMTIIPQKLRVNPERDNLHLKVIYTFVFGVMNALFVAYDSDPGAVIAFTGAIACFFIGYFYPIAIKVKIHYRNRRNNQKKLREETASLITSTTTVGEIQNNEPLGVIEGTEQKEETKSDTHADDHILVGSFSNLKILWYGFIMVFGTLLFIGEVYVLIKAL